MFTCKTKRQKGQNEDNLGIHNTIFSGFDGYESQHLSTKCRLHETCQPDKEQQVNSVKCLTKKSTETPISFCVHWKCPPAQYPPDVSASVLWTEVWVFYVRLPPAYLLATGAIPPRLQTEAGTHLQELYGANVWYVIKFILCKSRLEFTKHMHFSCRKVSVPKYQKILISFRKPIPKIWVSETLSEGVRKKNWVSDNVFGCPGHQNLMLQTIFHFS